jgi:hypothetical protein
MAKKKDDDTPSTTKDAQRDDAKIGTAAWPEGQEPESEQKKD